MVSSRWSYGPDGLREREVVHQPLLPRWRDVRPFLLRSAGVVGLVATIMAVVSSDALHLRGEEPTALAAVDPIDPPIVAPASELQPAEAAAPEAVVDEERVAASPSNPAAVGPASESPSATPVPIVVTSVSIAPETLSQPAPEADIASLINANVAPDEPELEVQPGGAAASEEASVEPPAALEAEPSSITTAAVEQPASLPSTTFPELRNGITPAPPTSETATTSSVASSPEALSSLAPEASDQPAAAISLSALRSSDMQAAAADPDRFDWPDGAATCPRDWVEAEGSRDAGNPDCTSTDSLLVSLAEDEQSALEEAAAEVATVLASLPRIPLPRPEPPADFEPSNPHKTVRVNRQNSSWPPDPPPNCAAGQRARWRFVDRGAGTKEWYCR